MANIKDGVYGFVSGTAGRSFTTKNGRAFEVGVKDDRQQYADIWTIWGDLPVVEGERLTVKGWLSVTRDKYEKDGETRVSIKRAVNNPELVTHESQQPSVSRSEPSDPYADSETPF